MIISKKMNAALNAQIGHEFAASLQYVEIASHFAGQGLERLAEHFFKQAGEERDHALRLVKYILDAGGNVAIPAIPAPKPVFKSAREAVQLSLNWEETVTRQISGLVTLANKENDYITRNMLEWFVKEQLEEISSMDTLLKVVTRAGEANLLQVEDTLHESEEGAAPTEEEE